MKKTQGFQMGISVLESPDKEKQIHYMRIVLISTTALIVASALLILNLLQDDAFRGALVVSAFVINAIGWFVLSRGRVALSGLILVLGYWVLTTFVIAQTGGLHSPWLMAQFTVIMLAGLLAGGKAGIVLGSLSLTVDFIFYRLQLNQLLASGSSTALLAETWGSTVINLFMATAVILIARQLARDSVDFARTGYKRYRSLFEKTNDAVFLIDMNQSYLDVNQQAADLLGYTVDELIGMPVEQIIVPEERNSSQKKIKLVDDDAMIPVYERTVVLKDGSRKTVEVNLALVADDEGNPVHYQSIVRDVSERKRLEQQLKDSLSEMEDIAMQDPLTGMLNRRAIMEHAEAEWHRSRRENYPMCLMVIDVDNLKTINDKMGHLAGDKALIVLSQAINRSKRRYDWTGRWGGDEFLMVLPGANLVEAEEVAERLRQQFKEAEFPGNSDESVRPHVSLGVACFSGRKGDETPLDKLLAYADQALYSAKEGGRDQVGVYRD
jgi:diguanylate cyclase (GGDEF)-like protein/PAS domain S-box-containing protein